MSIEIDDPAGVATFFVVIIRRASPGGRGKNINATWLVYFKFDRFVISKFTNYC